MTSRRELEVARQELADRLRRRGPRRASVKPTRSANRTVTRRRSATGAVPAAGVGPRSPAGTARCGRRAAPPRSASGAALPAEPRARAGSTSRTTAQAAASFDAALVAELAAGLVDGPARRALHPRNVACGGPSVASRPLAPTGVSRAGPGSPRPRRRTRRGSASASPRRRTRRRARAGRSPTARAASARSSRPR